MSSIPVVTLESVGPVAQICFTSESNRNALSSALRREFLAALKQVESNPDIRVVVLTHSGKVFSSGLDLTEISHESLGQALTELTEILDLLENYSKPLVCKLGGPAIAGGLGIVAACDFVIASDDLKFSFSEVRIGVSPAIISRFVLRKMNPRKATEYLLSGISFTSADAYTHGLINVCCQRQDLENVTSEYIEQLLKIEPTAFIESKKLLLAQQKGAVDVSEIIEISKSMFLSESAAEGRSALKDKRKPSWDISGDTQ